MSPIYSNILKPDPAPILDILNGLYKSNVLISAVRLGLFDCLAKVSPQGLSAQELSEQLADPTDEQLKTPSFDLLEGILLAAVALGLLTCDSKRLYFLTPLSHWYLTSSSGLSLSKYVVNFCAPIKRASDKLLTGLNEDKKDSLSSPKATSYAVDPDTSPLDTAVDILISTPESQDFSVEPGTHANTVAESGISQKTCNNSLPARSKDETDVDSDSRQFAISQCFASLYAGRVATTYDLSWVRRAAEVGGGVVAGGVMAAACAVYPLLEATVLDLPHIVARAQRPLVEAEASALSGSDHAADEETTTRGYNMNSPGGLDPGFRCSQDQNPSHRVRWLAGDYLTPEAYAPLARKTELFILTGLRFQVDLEQCRRLLALVYGALPAGGAVLVSEVRDLDGLEGVGSREPRDATLLFDCDACYDVYGHGCSPAGPGFSRGAGEADGSRFVGARGVQGYSILLFEAGFRNVQAKPTGTNLDVILAWK